MSNVPHDFLNDPELSHGINETIERIENLLRVPVNVQSAYDEFQNLVHKEMNNKLPKIMFKMALINVKSLYINHIGIMN